MSFFFPVNHTGNHNFKYNLQINCFFLQRFDTHEQVFIQTFAEVGAIPSPETLLTAKALATHDVIVSGTVVFIVT